MRQSTTHNPPTYYIQPRENVSGNPIEELLGPGYTGASENFMPPVAGMAVAERGSGATYFWKTPTTFSTAATDMVTVNLLGIYTGTLPIAIKRQIERVIGVIKRDGSLSDTY